MKTNINRVIRLITVLLIHQVTSEEVKCPTNHFFIYPCKCLSGGSRGVAITCTDANLAMISLGLANVKTPIESLSLINANISKLFGGIFLNLQILEFKIINSSLKTIEPEVFAPLTKNLQSLVLDGSRLNQISESAFSKLRNLTKLTIKNAENIVQVSDNQFSKLELIELDLSRNSIQKVSSNSFKELTLLEALHLHHNKLSAIEKNLFRETKKLKFLDLSHNRFSKFGRSDFNDLTSLVVFNLSNNQLTELPRSILARSSQLMHLDLSHNKLKEIDSYMLRGVRFLRSFLAQGNEITQLARNAFVSTTRIKTINLAENKLNVVDSEIFKNLQWLDRLNLSGNVINKMVSGAFQRMFQVSIDLSHNNISIIEANAFQELSNITELNLSYNKIEKIHPKAFDLSCDATILDLKHNLISNLSKVDIFGNLTGLRVIDLSYNQITALSRKDFTPKRLFEVHTVNLTHNQIKDLSGNVFEKFASLRFIDLSYNNLTKIGFSAFGTLPTLLELNISHNNISDITNGGVSSLVSVKTIYATDNIIKKMFAIPVALNVLHLERNNISSIRSNIFPMINSLLELYLDNNNLSKLEDNSFANCLTLRKLSLSHNKLEEVPLNALNHLVSLQYLHLSANQITKLRRQAFGNNLKVVFQLDLDGNNISDIRSDAFLGMLQLLQLNLSYNQISHLDSGVFNSLVSLRSLDLSYNQITQLDNKTNSIFEPLLSMEFVNISFNRVSLIKEHSFPSSPWIPYKIRHIDLSNNLIPILTLYFDDGMQKVEWISLKNNIINEIQTNVFSNITNLKHLDFSGNQLRKWNKGLFPEKMNKLTFLSLASNRLSSLNINELTNLPALKILDISYNKLVTIYEELLPKSKAGLELDIKGNEMYCDCNLLPFIAWFTNLKLKAVLEGQNEPTLDKWSLNTCKEPRHLRDKSIVDLQPTQLNCMPNVLNKYSGDFEEKSDLKIRAVEWVRRRRDSLRVVWLVLNRVDDIASFQLTIENDEKVLLDNATVDYNLREYTIKNIKDSRKYQICILALESTGQPRQLYPSQCAQFDTDNSDAKFSSFHRSKSIKLKTTETATSSSHLAKITWFVLFYCFFNIIINEKLNKI